MPYKDPEVRRAKVALYRAANLEQIRAQQREHYAATRDEKLAYRREYYATNREDLLARMRERHAQNPDVVRQRVKAWRKSHPDKVAEHWKRYRPPLTDADTQTYAEIVRQDPCSYCGLRATDVDHIDPRSRGGANDWTNLTAACRQCNSSKNANALLIWMALRA